MYKNKIALLREFSKYREFDTPDMSPSLALWYKDRFRDKTYHKRSEMSLYL